MTGPSEVLHSTQEAQVRWHSSSWLSDFMAFECRKRDACNGLCEMAPRRGYDGVMFARDDSMEHGEHDVMGAAAGCPSACTLFVP